MFTVDIRLKMVSTLNQIKEVCAKIRGCLELSEIPEEASITAISACAANLLLYLQSLRIESERIKSNTNDGICEFLDRQYNICMQPCGQCPTPDRLDCGGRWGDGHPNHLGKCFHIKST